ncbi:glucose-6-phosphate 1-dehydrogenase 1 [Agromyces luteolus]|uniref:Glucose-6-phosphate 1-dehydrogenase n=1 Tax=Agromyces luteolus TaxID=88373 RepID=A0A7C9M0X3_9MICO|nr:glucose-6-phosphate dehydrogenase [Agromyces luteolus]MUN08713.1 glucose-6-phosphate dehydrogenase [Agromyces luteolus]GLK27256.1 glucose-6-phosphate 1-dehydrogenase 1 [Agromyces luteolus]
MGATDHTTARRDVMVIFGITGDLARVKTFHSLYRLEERGLLDCPIVGVAFEDWTKDQLAQRARESITAQEGDLDEAVFARLMDRMSYAHGDFGKPETYDGVKQAMGGAEHPLFYLEVPPNLFATVVKGVAGAGLATNARFVIEKPFGHDLASAKALAAELHSVVDESQLLRVDHYLGKVGLEEIPFLRFANTLLAPVWNRDYIDHVEISMTEAFGVDDRGHFYDPVGALRDVVVNHLMQVVVAVAMEAPDYGDRSSLGRRRTELLREIVPVDPARYVRGQYRGYRDVDGVAADSTTETFAALELRIDNPRWEGVPFFIRTGKKLRATETEVRVVFREAPSLGFGLRGEAPPTNELVVRLGPTFGVRVALAAQRVDAATPELAELDVGFAATPGESPTPYEVLFEAALAGGGMRFASQDTIDAEWAVIQRLLDAPPPVQPYEPGTWGPSAADALIDGRGGWPEPWLDG